jgi:thymidine phosphorylase
VIKAMDAEAIGRAALFLGAGRAQAGAATDFAVGFSEIKKVGERVAPNEPLLFIHVRRERDLAAVWPLLEEGMELE